MSAWGITNFENDVALSFVEKITTHEKQLSIESYLSTFSDKFDPDETTLDECLELFTVVEILAAVQGAPCEELPIELQEWIVKCYIQVETIVAKDAVEVVELVMKDSEAKEMYVDTPYYKAWVTAQKDLIKRLKE